MVSLTRRMPDLKRSQALGIKALAMVLVLACLLVIRVWSALSSTDMPMMPMEAGADYMVTSDETQSHHECFDGTLRCQSMLGGVCPLAVVNCVPTYPTHLAVPQVQFPEHLVDSVWPSIWPSVPKQPPRL